MKPTPEKEFNISGYKSHRAISTDMSSQINMTAEQFDLEKIVRARNKYLISDWMVFYNETKNPAKIKFDLKPPNTLCVSISDSKGWVRLMKPIRLDSSINNFILELSTRALSTDGKSKIEPMVFLENAKGKFEKHEKFKFSDGKYRTRVAQPPAGSKLWIGFETSNSHVELFINHIQLKVIEGYDSLSQSNAEIKKLSLPVAESNAKNENYKNIIGHNKLFGKKIKENEWDFLLEYVSCVKRIEMPVTYRNMVRYLTLNHHRYDEKRLDILLHHIKTVLTIWHDKELLEIILKNCPELIFKLELNDDLFQQLMDLPDDSAQLLPLTNQKAGFYKYQLDTAKLFSFFKNEVKKDSNFFENCPQAYCALANCYRNGESGNHYYKLFVNEYLSKYKLPNIENIDLNGSNILASLNFEPVDKVRYGEVVSIIMSAYNSESTIEYAIQSLLNQSYQNIEILVCDDRSTDRTLDIIKSVAAQDNRVRVFQSNDNQGTYNIRNDMIAEASGEFITFQDSDDYALPTRIEIQVMALIRDQSLVCISNWARIKPDGAFVFFHDGLLNRKCMVSAMAHRSVLEKLPKFRSSLVAADTEFYELCKNTFGDKLISLLKRPLILGLWSDKSLTKIRTLNAEHNGFVAERRCAYAEIAARQRFLGSLIVTDEDVDNTLKDLKIYKNAATSVELKS